MRSLPPPAWRPMRIQMMEMICPCPHKVWRARSTVSTLHFLPRSGHADRRAAPITPIVERFTYLCSSSVSSSLAHPNPALCHMQLILEESPTYKGTSSSPLGQKRFSLPNFTPLSLLLRASTLERPFLNIHKVHVLLLVRFSVAGHGQLPLFFERAPWYTLSLSRDSPQLSFTFPTPAAVHTVFFLICHPYIRNLPSSQS
ncbi:hypothetical protein EDB86DRAFT_1616373 [Lactarius hatsudake]|nr:hypothetical protein EDB86DRAFT_1616373 [Lactarius hatsudake]